MDGARKTGMRATQVVRRAGRAGRFLAHWRHSAEIEYDVRGCFFTVCICAGGTFEILLNEEGRDLMAAVHSPANGGEQPKNVIACLPRSCLTHAPSDVCAVAQGDRMFSQDEPDGQRALT
jgi:hypothetical protein